eukprot:4752862-Pleurochrysis_carterae.AAC.2
MYVRARGRRIRVWPRVRVYVTRRRARRCLRSCAPELSRAGRVYPRASERPSELIGTSNEF